MQGGLQAEKAAPMGEGREEREAAAAAAAKRTGGSLHAAAPLGWLPLAEIPSWRLAKCSWVTAKAGLLGESQAPRSRFPAAACLRGEARAHRPN